MYAKSKRIIAIVLSMVMLFGLFSTTITALEMSDIPSSLSVEEAKPNTSEIIEVEDWREANVKHYRLPDGSYEAVVYSHSVHRQDASGKWVDINNNITEKTVGGVKQYSTQDDRIKFADSDDDLPVLIFTDNGYSVTMEFVEDTPSSTKRNIQAKNVGIAPIVTNAEITNILRVQSLEEVASIDNQSSIKYKNVSGNTDIEYVLVGNDVKENIILHSVADEYSYSFKLDLSGLIPVLENDGSISLNDLISGQTRYVIPAPYMYDSLGTISLEVAYTLTETNSQSYLLTVTADENWINSSERVFPITIDPTIKGDDVVFDTYISSAYKDTNYGDSEQIWISSTRTAFILIDPPYSIPEGSTVTHATLNLPFYYNVSDGDLDIGAYEILYPWDEYEVTWNIANQNPNLGISTSLISTANLDAEDSGGVDDPGIATLNITNLMQEWIDGAPNNGIALKYISGTNLSVILRSWEIDNSAESYYRVTYYPLIDMSVTTERMGVGGTQQATYSTYPSGLTPTWTSTNTSVATVNSSGLITAKGEGSTYIRASCYDSTSGKTYTDSVYLYVYDSTGIKDNTSYYIMNYSSKRLLSLETASDSTFTNVFTRVRSTSTLSQWTTEKQADGRYQLISDYSSTGKCLDVTNSNVDIYTDTGGQYLKFTIDRVESGTYQGLYLIRYGNKYVAQDTDYNVYVTTSRSAAAYWSFMAVDQRYAELFCHDYTYTDDNGNSRHFDTSENYTYFKTVFSALGYSALSYENPTSTAAYTYLWRDDDVFVFMGHGGGGRIAFYKAGNVATGRILAHSNMGFSGTSPYYISDLDDNKLALARCVLYLGCSTGVDYTNNSGTYNLVDATFDKGAHFVLGTTETLYTSQINDWMEYFLTSVSEGKSIQEALISASDELGIISVPYEKSDGSEGTKSVDGLPTYFVGDKSQYLNIE